MKKGDSVAVDVSAELWEAAKSGRAIADMMVSAVSAEFLFKAKYPRWLRGVAWWWHSAPLWERVMTVVFAPVTVPLALVFLLFNGLLMFPLLICCLWGAVMGKPEVK